MHANSRPVTSKQSGPHEQLIPLLERHRNSPFKKPIADANRQAFEQSMAAWRKAGSAPLIIDAGCGVGLSTLNLAQQFPDSFVIGIDQSADRLARNTAWPGKLPNNYALARADLVDFWRLLLEARIFPTRHYLLYPNPWPKKSQLSRRWQGHAVFPTLLALGGVIECRSNWKIYIDEFAAAVTQLSNQPACCEAYFVAGPKQTHDGLPAPISPFEEKYRASGHALWRCQVELAAQ